MQTAKAASTVARIAEHIIALWHSKVFTFWSHRLEKRLIDESIENKILMRLCCNGVVLLRLTRRGRAGSPKNSAKKSKVPAPVNRFAQSRRNCRGGAGSPACDQHKPYCFHRVSRGQSGHSPQAQAYLENFTANLRRGVQPNSNGLGLTREWERDWAS